MDNTMKIWNINTGKEIASLISLDLTDWAIVTPEGYFDASPNGMNYLHYVQGLDVLPLESFFDKFYSPELLPQLMAETFEPKKENVPDFSGKIKLPPLVKITSPDNGKVFNSNEIPVTVEITNQGGGINEIRVYVENKIISSEKNEKGDEIPLNNNFKKTFNIKLNSGKNCIRVTAFNNERTESIPAEISVTLSKPKPESNLYIIAVGLDNYENSSYHLNYCKSDAMEFTNTLKTKGKKIFKDIKKIEIYDSQAIKKNIQDAFDNFSLEASEEDVFVFYYSGHGALTEGTSSLIPQDFYMVLYDVVKTNGADEHLNEKGISGKYLSELCTKIKARKQLIILDACHSGGAQFSLNKEPVEEKALYQLSKSTGVFILAASGKDQTAKERPELKHGIFTYALLQGMDCSENKEFIGGLIQIEPLNKYVYDKVIELTEKYLTTVQRPLNWSKKEYDFPIGVCDK